ncbi:MAG: hypothetical protein ACFB0C_24155 [Leptolyngbyaceae cyanobacterium]
MTSTTENHRTQPISDVWNVGLGPESLRSVTWVQASNRLSGKDKNGLKPQLNQCLANLQDGLIMAQL